MTTKLSKYNAAAIQVYDNLTAVRKRPGMYIGDVDKGGVFQLFREVIDNAIDELINGFGSEIHVVILNNRTIGIVDNGRGVPIDKNLKHKKKAIYLIYEHLHAGGKFDSNSYRVSSGLHGVGAAVVNALSESFAVYTIANKQTYVVKYRNGGQRIQEIAVMKNSLPLAVQNLTGSGTAVQFTYDARIFDPNISYDLGEIKKYCQEKAYLCSRLKFIINDNRTGEKVVYAFANELSDYQTHLTSGWKTVFTKNIFIIYQKDDVTIKIIFNYYSNYHNIDIKSFANYIPTPNGGTHVQGFRQAIAKCITNYMKKNNIALPIGLLPNDILQGIMAIILVLMPEKQIIFEGQTKTRLSTTIIKNLVNKAITEHFMKFLNFNRNTASTIIKQILLNYKARLSARKVRADMLADRPTRLSKILLAGRLIQCFSKKPSECELFLVEGDSAGGTAKSARAKQNQAILPLKGKILNTYDVSQETFLNNKEVNSLITTLECGCSSHFDYDKLRYHKIIIMTDADTDGAHIRALLITLFWKHLQQLLIRGNIYVACAPLFCASMIGKKSNIVRYFWNEDDLNNWLAKNENKKISIQRYKGLGEMNADQLRDTTMDPKKRRLIRLRIDSELNASTEIEILMGKNAERRKEWINKYVDFSQVVNN